MSGTPGATAGDTGESFLVKRTIGLSAAKSSACSRPSAQAISRARSRLPTMIARGFSSRNFRLFNRSTAWLFIASAAR